MKYAALYARVSTADGRQSVENQIQVLTKYAAENGLHIKRTYREEASGGGAKRPVLEKMMEDGRAGNFGTVLVFALDRLTREGVLPAFEYIHRLTRLGIVLVSVTEPHFTTAGPAGELFIAIAAWMAKQERQLMQARVKAGLTEARRNGVILGRPKSTFDLLKMKMLYVDGRSLRQIAKELNLSKSTVERASRAWRQKRNPDHARTE